MKQLTSIVLGLMPPGTLLASIQKYQDWLFRTTGNISALGVLPLLPLLSYSRCVDPPDELRLEETLSFSSPVEFSGSVYLPLENRKALGSLTEKLPLGYALSEGNDGLLFPIFPGFFLYRGKDPEFSTGFLPREKRFRSAGLSAVLVEYRCSQPRNGWWECIEERIHWELPVRKPAKNKTAAE